MAHGNMQSVVTYSNTASNRDFFAFVRVAEPEQIQEALQTCEKRASVRDHLGEMLSARIPVLQQALRLS